MQPPTIYRFVSLARALDVKVIKVRMQLEVPGAWDDLDGLAKQYQLHTGATCSQTSIYMSDSDACHSFERPWQCLITVVIHVKCFIDELLRFLLLARRKPLSLLSAGQHGTLNGLPCAFGPLAGSHSVKPVPSEQDQSEDS